MNWIAKYTPKPWLGLDSRVLLTENAKYRLFLQTNFLPQWQLAQPTKISSQISRDSVTLMLATSPKMESKKETNRLPKKKLYCQDIYAKEQKKTTKYLINLNVPYFLFL